MKLWTCSSPKNGSPARRCYVSKFRLFTLIAAFGLLLPFSLYFAGLHNLGPTRAIVTSCLEPVFAVAGAAIFVGETARPLQVMGIVIVLVATVLVQLPDKEQQAALMEP